MMYVFYLRIYYVCEIGGSEGSAIGEMLKVNSTLVKLNLWNEELKLND